MFQGDWWTYSYSFLCSYYLSISTTRLVTKLANLVADGKDKLHLDFVDAGPSRLAEYLQAVKEAILDGMEGVSDPFLAAA